MIPLRSRRWAPALLVVLVVACAPAGPEPAGPEPGLPPVTLAAGTPAGDAEQEASRLLGEAREALNAGRPEVAASAARRVVEAHPATRASGEAARVLVEALEAAGRPAEAVEPARLYRTALREGDPRRPEALLREGELLRRAGEPADAARTLLQIAPDAPGEVRDDALTTIRQVAPELEEATLSNLLEATPLGQPLAAPLMVAWARNLRLAGEGEEARRYARAAVEAGATGPDLDAARGLLGDPVDETAVRPARLGAVLPATGSPALQRYATGVEEGVRAALHARGVTALELAIQDDGGEPGRAATAVESPGPGAPVVGWVGPLTEEALARAAEARAEPTPMISPTALDTRGAPSVYSLQGFDPGAARTLAEYAAESDLRVVVIMHPDEPGASFEARVFQERFTELRGSVVRTLTYPPGATHFEEQLRAAEILRPDALVLPIPARDIEALAPQVSFFGLDTLGVKVLGTADWAREEILETVAPRHTNGVVAATPRQPGPETEGHRRFREAYEARFQRSLRDPVPALGWDAASLLLLAVETGARTPAEVQAALPRIRDFPGATGVLSVEEGRIVRRHQLVCLQARDLLPVEPGQVTLHHRPMRPGDPEEGEPERVPAGPLEIYCPGAAPPDLAPGAR